MVGIFNLLVTSTTYKIFMKHMAWMISNEVSQSSFTLNAMDFDPYDELHYFIQWILFHSMLSFIFYIWKNNRNR